MKNRIIAALFPMLAAGFAVADESMSARPGWPPPMHEPPPILMIDGDRLEAGFGDGEEAWAWDLGAWYGDGRTRWRVETEGEAGFGERPDESDVELTFARLFHPFWEWQVGVRHSTEPVSGTDLVLGIEGVAPWMIEIDAALYAGESGGVELGFEAEHDLYLAQRTILQSRFEFEAATDSRAEAGSGVRETALGLRLRHELRREFAPYLGVEWDRRWGRTADLARTAGESASEIVWLAGVRFWF